MDSFLGVADAGCAGAPNCVGQLADPVLRRALRHLSPGILRLGGITADWVQYQLKPPAPSPTGQLGGYWPVQERNLTAAKIQGLLSFVSAIEFDLVFDLNELHGRDCQLNSSCHPNCTCTGPWDSSNARELLQWFHRDYAARDSKVYGFELGNELTRSHHITMEENVEDVQHLGIFSQTLTFKLSRS